MRKNITIGLGTLVVVVLVLPFAVVWQPVPPFAFMERYACRRARTDEVRSLSSEAAYVLRGSWPEMKRTATVELAQYGYRPVLMMGGGHIAQFSNGSVDKSNGTYRIDVILAADVQDFGQFGASVPCTVVLVIAKDVGRTRWNQLVDFLTGN